MSNGVTIVLNGIPRGKARPRFRMGRPRPFTPKETREAEFDLGWAARAAMAGHPMFAGAVVLDACFTMPIPASWSERKRSAALRGDVQPTTKPDADNFLKLALDGLNKIVWKDDSQVTRATVRKRYGALPGTVIVVRSAEPGASA